MSPFEAPPYCAGSGRINLYLHTLRFLGPQQVRHRLKRILKTRLRRTLKLCAAAPQDAALKPFRHLYSGITQLGAQAESAQSRLALQRARCLAKGRFRFLGKTVECDGHPPWNDSGQSRLWRYHLHYFHYLQDLMLWAAAGEAAEAYQCFRRLSWSWMESNQRMVGDGWHPYTISLRMVNWLNACGFFRDRLERDPEFRDRIAGSLQAQAQSLESDLEFDVRGNHLFENLRALIWAGVALQGDDAHRWLKRGVALLEEQLDEQVLADGGHFERNPAYHLSVLKGCVEIAALLRANRLTSPRGLEPAIERMLDYAALLSGWSRRIPLLKDSTLDGPGPGEVIAAAAVYLQRPGVVSADQAGLLPSMIFPPADCGPALEARAQSPGVSRFLPQSGLCLMRNGRPQDCLVFDVGKPCPDYLPAHAHADLLSYELSLGGEPIVVDSGVYEYAAGLWRDFFRSTRAHNTVEVSGCNQSEVWSSFRVARRAQPFQVHWRPGDRHVLASAGHDGYRRLSPPVLHRRTILGADAGHWLVLDQLQGGQAVQAESHVHFHPQVVLQEWDERSWRAEWPQGEMWLTAFGFTGHRIVRGRTSPFPQGWYSERFGSKTPNTALSLKVEGPLPRSFGYLLSRSGPAMIEIEGESSQLKVSVEAGGTACELIVPAQGTPEARCE